MVTVPKYPTHRRVKGGTQIRDWDPATGYGPWRLIPDPNCKRCGDTGQVRTAELVDPSDPWSEHKTIPCPTGCERKQ